MQTDSRQKAEYNTTASTLKKRGCREQAVPYVPTAKLQSRLYGEEMKKVDITNIGHSICNACGLYFKLHNAHRPYFSTTKRRRRTPIRFESSAPLTGDNMTQQAPTERIELPAISIPITSESHHDDSQADRQYTSKLPSLKRLIGDHGNNSENRVRSSSANPYLPSLKTHVSMQRARSLNDQSTVFDQRGVRSFYSLHHRHIPTSSGQIRRGSLETHPPPRQAIPSGRDAEMRSSSYSEQRKLPPLAPIVSKWSNIARLIHQSTEWSRTEVTRLDSECESGNGRGDSLSEQVRSADTDMAVCRSPKRIFDDTSRGDTRNNENQRPAKNSTSFMKLASILHTI
jgi:hypothetical protein